MRGRALRYVICSAARIYIEWYPLAILTLAHNAEPPDEEFIRSSFASAARFGVSLNLGAWVTAHIEIDG